MMRTTEERIQELHTRANTLEKRRIRRQMEALGATSFVLAALVVGALLQVGGTPLLVPEDQFTGTSLLSQSAGGYVLAAVIAFFIGVAVTVMISKRRVRR